MATQGIPNVSTIEAIVVVGNLGGRKMIPGMGKVGRGKMIRGMGKVGARVEEDVTVARKTRAVGSLHRKAAEEVKAKGARMMVPLILFPSIESGMKMMINSFRQRHVQDQSHTPMFHNLLSLLHLARLDYCRYARQCRTIDQVVLQSQLLPQLAEKLWQSLCQHMPR